MKKNIVIIIFLLITQYVVSQKRVSYLLIENPFIVKNDNNLTTSFSIKSKDIRFNLDYYQFRLLNYKGWDDNGKDIFLTLKELRKEIKIDTVKYQTIKSLTKNKEWWQVHNELSLNRKIFLLEKINVKENGEYKTKYYILPMIYEGTRKNIVPTDLSVKRN